MLFTACQPTKPTVSVLGVWGGSELEVFNQIIDVFEGDNETTIEFESTRDINAVLTSRVEAGNPPDIAIIPQLSLVVDLAKQGSIKDLTTVLDIDSIRKSYATSWINLGSVDGTFYGLFFKTAIKGLVYYNRQAFARLNIKVPVDWDALLQISNTIADTGVTPWSIGIESGNASGWPATDWIENIFVRLYGSIVYREWYEGKLSWTSDKVKKAWQMFGDIAADNRMVCGGRDGVISTSFQDAANPVFSDSPGAYMIQQASFMAGMIRDNFPDLTYQEDFSFFKLPPINEFYDAVEIAGDILVAFNDKPGTKSFMNYLSTADAQAYFAQTGAMMPNKELSIDSYNTEIDKESARILKDADTIVFDASDMMPSEINAAFWSATIEFIRNPDRLDEILAELEAVSKDVYKK
jgi:alpha-glucoside transport system substrate-binding protein